MSYQTRGAKFTNCINCMCQKNPKHKNSQNLHSQIMLGEMKMNITEIRVDRTLPSK